MKITKVEIRTLRLPMLQSFKLSLGELGYKETIITSLHTAEGLVGYGESSTFPSPIFSAETTASCMQVQEHFIAPRIVGTAFGSVQEFREAYADLVGNHMAQTGPECAFWHLLSQHQNVSLKTLVGGTKTEIPVGESIAIKPSIEETLQVVEQRLREGYLRIKLKIEPGWDSKVVAAVRAAWPEIDLSVDGNMAYSLDKDKEVLQSLDDFHLSLLEQPLAADDLAGHAALQRDLRTPICLDESITDLATLKTADALHALRILNIKPTRVGGLSESLRLYDYAAAHGIQVWCGGMFETGIGRAFNIALASKQNFTYPADMSPHQVYFKEDLIEPSYVVKPNGHIDVPDKPGLGYDICTDRIEKFTVQKKVITEGLHRAG
jgi:o-succinylbenzoate synthase